MEKFGPFECNRKDAWLGQGYYYWEHFIENAHWWGKTSYPTLGYMICESTCILTEENCFDLIGTPEHLELFRAIVDLLVEKGATIEKITVARVLEFLRKDAKVFKFKAVRTGSINTRYKDSDYEKRIYFKHKSFAYLDYQPPLQICFYDKSACHLAEYKIIYPLEYVDGYVV